MLPTNGDVEGSLGHQSQTAKLHIRLELSTGLELRQLHAQLDDKAALGEVGRDTVNLKAANAIDFHVLDEQTALDAIVRVAEDAALIEVRIDGAHAILGQSLALQLRHNRCEQATNAFIQLWRAEAAARRGWWCNCSESEKEREIGRLVTALGKEN